LRAGRDNGRLGEELMLLKEANSDLQDQMRGLLKNADWFGFLRVGGRMIGPDRGFL